jgi:arginase
MPRTMTWHLQRDKMENRICLTPLFLDKPVPGLEVLVKPDWRVNKPPLPDGDTTTRMSAVHEAIARFVVDTLATGQRPVSIAADCCTAIGMLAGLQRTGLQPTLIWFDAHGDFNTTETTPSGFLGGMPLAMIVGRGDLTLPAAVGLVPLPEKQVILTDGRDLDPGERDLIVNSGVVHLVDPADLLDYPLPGGPLTVHFDMDIISLAESPAQNYPAVGGPSAALLQAVFRRLTRTGKITAVSVSTWNPELDPDRKSEIVSMSLLETLIGETIP